MAKFIDSPFVLPSITRPFYNYEYAPIWYSFNFLNQNTVPYQPQGRTRRIPKQQMLRPQKT